MLDDYLPLALISLCTVACYVYIKRPKSHLPMPPSPKSDFLIGHLRSLPSSDAPRIYRDMGLELNSNNSSFVALTASNKFSGDIISLTALGQVIVVLNSAEVATDLLVKKSSIYFDRPEIPMLSDERLYVFSSFV